MMKIATEADYYEPTLFENFNNSPRNRRLLFGRLRGKL